MNSTTPTGRLGRAVAAAGAIAMIAASCATDDPASTNTAATPPTTDVATTAAEPVIDEARSAYDASTTPLDFESCGGGFDCAMFAVPRDYDDLTGDTVEIHVTRRVASADSIGPLFLNPGGPGFGAEDMVRGLGQYGPPPLSDNFDLIGIDPRGTGRSAAIDCNSDEDADARRRLVTEPADVQAYITDFEDLAATCAADYDVDYLASITTENAARDMESVRLALGAESLNYYGASYGTAIGSVYATLFPDSIRSMVLDAAVPTDPEDGTFEARAAGFEEAIVRLDTSCELWPGCALDDTGLIDAIDQVAATLEADGNIGNLDLTRFESAIGLLYGVPAAMPDVAEGLAAALEGSGSLLAQIGVDGLTFVPDTDRQVINSGAKQAIACADGWNLESSTAGELAGQAERTAAIAPNAGPGWETPCDLWPVTGPGIPAVSYTGDAPILVIGTEGDPVTPLAWSEDLADDLGENASLVVFEGTGHTAAFQVPGCIDDHVLAALLEQQLPADRSRCAAAGLVGLGYPDSPVVIDRVTVGSPAEAAGLLIGDEIVESDGQPVETWMDVLPGGLGEPLELVVDRDGEILEFSVVRGPAFWEYWRLAE
ncbi:MAG: alpha/beta fold hydrolase [Ilumatobacter sp.]